MCGIFGIVSNATTCSCRDDGCRHEDESIRNRHIRRSGGQNSAEAAENGSSKAANHPHASPSALAKPLIRSSLIRVRDENQTRYPNVKWYLDAIGMDFTEVVTVINSNPRLYEG